MNLSFINVRPTQSVNVSQIKQALLLPIVCPSTLGYTLDDDGVWRDEEGLSLNRLSHPTIAIAIAIATANGIGGLEVEYKIPQGRPYYTTINESVSLDTLDGDNRLLIIELENECIVAVIDMNFIVTLKDKSFEVQRLKEFGFLY